MYMDDVDTTWWVSLSLPVASSRVCASTDTPVPAYAPTPSYPHTLTHTFTRTHSHAHTHTPGIDTKDGPGLKVFQRQTKWAGKDAVVVGMDGKYNNIKEMAKVEAAFADSSTKSAVSLICIYVYRYIMVHRCRYVLTRIHTR